MAFVGWALLLFLAQLHALVASSVHAGGNLTHHSAPSLCHPGQANTLLKLKQSFFFFYSTTNLASWQDGTDCCLWEGVSCNNSGHVTALDLSGFGLYSRGIDPVLFNLTSLRLLDLSMNNFGDEEYDIPSVGFERLALLAHLDLSNSGISGQIPAGISKLTNLVSLHLSSAYPLVINRSYVDSGAYDLNTDYDKFVNMDFSFNDLREYYFHNLVANLNNLRELMLDGVFISSRAEDCFKALAKSTPHLRVLSLNHCGLQGHFDRSLSRLGYLVMINLSGNYGMTSGPFPEFIMNFLNLSVLRLAGINLGGCFPRGVFQSNNLRVLDLSRNPDLSGNMPNFSNAIALEILRLDMTNFSYAKSKSSSNFNSVMELGLDGNIISLDFLSLFSISLSLRKLVLTRISSQRNLEPVFSWIKDNRNLMSLVLHECDFFTATTSSVGNLNGLGSFVISGSNLTVETFSAVTNLKNLKTLVILQCDLFGQLPSAIGNMSNLERLAIFNTRISGPMPHEVGRMMKLTSLWLRNTDISGRIPNSIANLTRLTRLMLEENQLSGEISTSLFTLPVLRILSLIGNQLSGAVQEFDVISSHLNTIALDRNHLMGPIPESFFLLTSLKFLDIGWNNFSGSVDLASLWRLENLTILHLSNNELSVTDKEGSNSSSTYLSRLRVLGLARCNITKIPNLLTRLNHMVYLDLSSNKINGNIPKWIWERRNGSLTSLNISHNMFTGIELTSSIIPFSNYLESFDISSNRLQGQIPMPSSSAQFLDYSNNKFSSVLPNFTLYLSDTDYLSLSKNNISGYLPPSICDAKQIEVLDLSYNKFKGQIPPCLMENQFTSILNLRGNQFEGALPSNISSGCSLQTIDLHGNKIEGQLPRALYNCIDLEVLDLGGNLITDTFPSWLGTLLNLRVLVLRSNKLHGSIGYLKDEKSGEKFPSLQIIDLASNNFTGNLHPQWFENLKSMELLNNTGQIIGHQNMTAGFYQDVVTISYKGLLVTFERILTTLTAIDLSDNKLEGSIPSSIGQLVSLHVLNMSHNAFTGEIPRQFGGMTALESLDLSSNMLSGVIPRELTNLTFLSILNLSNNQLEGRIPQSRQFATFQNGSFDGNAGLCGLPLSKQCGTPYTPKDIHMKSSSGSVDIVLFLFVGVGFGIGFAAAILVRPGWIKSWFRNVI